METGIFIDRRHDALLIVGVQTAYMRTHEWDGKTVPGGGEPLGEAHQILPAVLEVVTKFPPECRLYNPESIRLGHARPAATEEQSNTPPLIPRHPH